MYLKVGALYVYIISFFSVIFLWNLESRNQFNFKYELIQLILGNFCLKLG